MYAHWVPEERILCTNLWSAELSKLTANAMLAQRISSINAISALCETTGADVQQVAHAIGSCFQKDILNLVYICQSLGLDQIAVYWQSVIHMNDYQKQRFVERILSAMFNTISGKKIAVLGFAFKKDTGDTRESPAITVCQGLIGDGAELNIYDPRVGKDEIFRALSAPKFTWDHPMMGNGLSEHFSCEDIEQAVSVHQNPYQAMAETHGICVLTEWDEFKTYNWRKVYTSMSKPAFIFDGRNILDHATLRQLGFIVYAVGKPLEPFLQSN